jgi:hypothetical protein
MLRSDALAESLACCDVFACTHRLYAQPGCCKIGRLFDLIRDNSEVCKLGRSEASGNGDLGNIAAARNKKPTDAGHVVSCIECIPPPAQEGFESCTEVRRREISQAASDTADAMQVSSPLVDPMDFGQP